MSCEFNHDEIGLALRALAKQAGISVVISERIQGTVTMRLEHTTAKEAMETILKAKGAVMDEKGGVYFIKTPMEQAAERALEPATNQLERTATDQAIPVAHFKGEYYKALIKEGVRQSVSIQTWSSHSLLLPMRHERVNGSPPKYFNALPESCSTYRRMKDSLFLGLLLGCICFSMAHADPKLERTAGVIEQAVESLDEPQDADPSPPAQMEDKEDKKEDADEDTPALPRQTFEFQGEEIGLVFRQLAKQAGISLVVSDKVQGTVTMRMENETANRALEVIVDSKGLLMDEKEGVFFIRTPEERSREPISSQLQYAATHLAEPVAQFKGHYYKSLVQEGIPPNLAEEMVRQETITALVLPHPKDDAPSSPSTSIASSKPSAAVSSDSNPLSQWADKITSALTWAGIGAAVLSYLPIIFVHLAFGIAVYLAARRKRKGGGTLLFFGPFLWALVTLSSGVIGAAIYWLANESAIARPTSPPQLGQ